MGNLTYLAAEWSGLRVIDASNPVSPFELGKLPTPETPRSVDVVDDLAYVADDDSGLRIIDFGLEYAGPEPSELLLLGVGVGVLAVLRRASRLQ